MCTQQEKKLEEEDEALIKSIVFNVSSSFLCIFPPLFIVISFSFLCEELRILMYMVNNIL